MRTITLVASKVSIKQYNKAYDKLQAKGIKLVLVIK